MPDAYSRKVARPTRRSEVARPYRREDLKAKRIMASSGDLWARSRSHPAPSGRGVCAWKRHVRGHSYSEITRRPLPASPC